MDFIANSSARGHWEQVHLSLRYGTNGPVPNAPLFPMPPLTPVALNPIIRVTAFIKIKRENH